MRSADLAAVGNQDFLEHASENEERLPYSTGWPFSTSTAFTTPEASASISFISFIAYDDADRLAFLDGLPTSTKGLASGDAER